MTDFTGLKVQVNELSQSLQALRRRWLKRLFAIAILAVLGLWLSESQIRHALAPIDQIAYPGLLLSFSLSLGLLQWRSQFYPIALVGTVGSVVVYTVAFLQEIVWGYIPIWDNYDLATFSQWFPFTYVVIFLFIPRRWAIASSLSIYLILVVTSGLQGWWQRELPIEEQIFPYLLHMMMAHPIYIAVFTAVATLQTSLSRAQAEAQMADVDPLTNLLNRRAALRAISTASTTHPSTSTIGLLLIDVDHFKIINDTLGHDVGDQVLMQIAQLLQQAVRDSDKVARWGGEEFLVILTQTSASDLAQTAERLRYHLVQHIHPQIGTVTASFGAALLQPGEPITRGIKRADHAMYQAKQNGRNCVAIAEVSVNSMRLQGDLQPS